MIIWIRSIRCPTSRGDIASIYRKNLSRKKTHEDLVGFFPRRILYILHRPSTFLPFIPLCSMIKFSSSSAPTSFWVGPTILSHKSASDPAAREEIFGPVLSVLKVETSDEAIAIENANPFGNAACIYTSIGQHSEYFLKRFNAGMLGVNVGVPVPREPFSFGGMNMSNFGTSDITGDGCMEFFTQRKKITQKWVPPQDGGVMVSSFIS